MPIRLKMTVFPIRKIIQGQDVKFGLVNHLYKNDLGIELTVAIVAFWPLELVYPQLLVKGSTKVAVSVS